MAVRKSFQHLDQLLVVEVEAEVAVVPFFNQVLTHPDCALEHLTKATIIGSSYIRTLQYPLRHNHLSLWRQ